MLLGLLFATAACFLWGTIFVVPQFLTDFSAMEVALGRYFSYGLLSALLVLFKGPTKIIKRYPLKVWIKAFNFGLIANVIYYIGIVVGCRFATAPVTVLIVGICPIFAAVYGNWQMREIPFRTLFISCLGILLGIVAVNAHEIDWSFQDLSFKEYLFGVAGALVALVTWGWYAVNNARFLKENPGICRIEWTTLIGVSTLFWVVLLGAGCSIGKNPSIDFSTFFQKDLLLFFTATGFLGVFCGWLGGYFWNRASGVVPISILGPFIIFETLFGIFFVYLYEARVPVLSELVGIAAMLAGITFSVISFYRTPLPSE
jgi:drug/metabolite transporter (DMT)-like permease